MAADCSLPASAFLPRGSCPSGLDFGYQRLWVCPGTVGKGEGNHGPSGAVGAGLVDEEHVGLTRDTELLTGRQRRARRCDSSRTDFFRPVPAAGALDPVDVQGSAVVDHEDAGLIKAELLRNGQ